MSRAVHLAAIGDVNSPVTWSGIPYHFLLAGRRSGLIDDGLPLATDRTIWRLRRVLWNLGSVLGLDRPGGFQYSDRFLERLWEPIRPRIEGDVLLNCFQLYPPSIVADPGLEKWFYVDMTLRQLFDYYEIRATIGRRAARQALEREQAGYQAARGVIAHSAWAARSVERDYGIPPDRIRVAVPGASLDPEAYARWEERTPASPPPGDPLRLVFVGKEWRRKGLDRLLQAIAAGRNRGLRARLRVVGCPPERLPYPLARVEGVEWIGFVDKRTDAERFLRTIAGADIGCLLSVAEAGGIALREYAALGLAILGPDTGGAPEHTTPGASILVPPGASAREIASILLDLESDRERLVRMKHAAWEHRREALWEASVRTILSFWPHVRARCGA